MANARCSLLHRMMATEPQHHITLGSPLSNETTSTRLGLPYASDRSVQKRKLACRTLYMKSLFLVESCDLCLSSQYILVRVIPSCFHFVKICLCLVSLLSMCSLRFFKFSSWESCTLFIWMEEGGCTFLFIW
jgi:hypothetical protein